MLRPTQSLSRCRALRMFAGTQHDAARGDWRDLSLRRRKNARHFDANAVESNGGIMATVQLNMDSKSIEAIDLVRLVSENDPDLLLEFLDGFLQLIQGRKAITCDYDDLPAPGADTLIGVLKLGDEFISRVAAIGALYRQRGFVVPGSLDEAHIGSRV